MAIFSVYVVSKSGGLIYHYDHPSMPKIEVEKTYGYPLDLKIECQSKKFIVVFGQGDGVKVGHALMSINGVNLDGTKLVDGRDVQQVLDDATNYPISLKFGRPKLSTNERIVLASTFHSLYAIASQLSPEPKSSGIEVLEADTFKLHCYQTVTGIKFIALSDVKQTGVDIVLQKLFEVYSDYALKNPFYSLEMPIRCDLFDTNLQNVLEQLD